MGRLAVGAAVCVMLSGCGSSSSTENGPGSFIGHASNAVVFIQWTRTGGSVSGSLREALTKKGGRGVSSEAKPFTGTIDGKGLSLQLGSETLVGQFDGKSAFSLSLPGTGAVLATINLAPGEVADYNRGVENLVLSEFTSPCALYASEAKVEFSGTKAPSQCDHFVQRQSKTEWTTEEPSSSPTEQSTVCELTNAANERAVVSDTGEQDNGHEACTALSLEDWDSAPPPAGTTDLNTAAVAHSITESILAERHLHATVECPPVVAQTVGKTFDCIATTGDGSKTPFVVTVRSSSGYVTFVGK